MLPADDEIKLIAKESVMWIANEVNQEGSYCGIERYACALVETLCHEHLTCPYLRRDEYSALLIRKRKLSQLEERIGATAIELTPGDPKEIDAAASQIRVEGDRYSEPLEDMTGR